LATSKSPTLTKLFHHRHEFNAHPFKILTVSPANKAKQNAELNRESWNLLYYRFAIGLDQIVASITKFTVKPINAKEFTEAYDQIEPK